MPALSPGNRRQPCSDLEPVYQLERLSGRYSSWISERTDRARVHGLAEERPLDLWSLAREISRNLLPGVDAYYGTATYLPMADGARFKVTLEPGRPDCTPDQRPGARSCRAIGESRRNDFALC